MIIYKWIINQENNLKKNICWILYFVIWYIILLDLILSYIKFFAHNITNFSNLWKPLSILCVFIPFGLKEFSDITKNEKALALGVLFWLVFILISVFSLLVWMKIKFDNKQKLKNKARAETPTNDNNYNKTNTVPKYEPNHFTQEEINVTESPLNKTKKETMDTVNLKDDNNDSGKNTNAETINKIKKDNAKKVNNKKIKIESCKKEDLLTIDGFDERKADKFISERDKGKVYYDIESFVADYGLMPHQMIEIQDRLVFPQKPKNKIGRKIEW